MHIQILLTMSFLPMPMTNITTNTFMKMDNTAIRFLDVVYFLGMAAKIQRANFTSHMASIRLR